MKSTSPCSAARAVKNHTKKIKKAAVQWTATEEENKFKWHEHGAEWFLSALNLILIPEISYCVCVWTEVMKLKTGQYDGTQKLNQAERLSLFTYFYDMTVIVTRLSDYICARHRSETLRNIQLFSHEENNKTTLSENLAKRETSLFH